MPITEAAGSTLLGRKYLVSDAHDTSKSRLTGIPLLVGAGVCIR